MTTGGCDNWRDIALLEVVGKVVARVITISGWMWELPGALPFFNFPSAISNLLSGLSKSVSHGLCLTCSITSLDVQHLAEVSPPPLLLTRGSHTWAAILILNSDHLAPSSTTLHVPDALPDTTRSLLA